MYLLTAAGLFAPQAPGVVRAGVHAVVARVARAAAAVPGHGVAGGGGVAEGAVLGAPQPELSPRTRVPARGARVARAAGAGAGPARGDGRVVACGQNHVTFCIWHMVRW